MTAHTPLMYSLLFHISVHELTPPDIGVVAALGDSITVSKRRN